MPHPIIPTILVPGIKGTKLVDVNKLDFDTIWSGIQSKFETIEDLRLQNEPRFDAEEDVIIERGDVEDLAYRQFYQLLNKRRLGPIFIFGYDWRRSNLENGKKLLGFIRNLQGKLGHPRSKVRFNFVTHSMGGLVFSAFLRELPQSERHCIHRVVCTVPPFLGSIRILTILLVGEGGVRLPFFNSNDAFRKVARSFPSVYEMLPRWEKAVTFAKGHDSFGQSFDIFDHRHWQSNIVGKKPFKTRLAAASKEFSRLDKDVFHLKGLPSNLRKRMLILVGTNEQTEESVLVKRKNGQVTNFFDLDGATPSSDGDGTVPGKSSKFYQNEILTLEVKSKFLDSVGHGLFLNDGRVQDVILRFLRKKNKGKSWYTVVSGTVSKVGKATDS